MKKIICLLLSLLLAMTVLTSCDYLASILDNFDFEPIIPQTTTTVTEVTTAEVTTPEVTTPEVTTPEVTTPEVTTPEVTTPEVTTPEVTTPEVTTPEVTTPEVTTPEPEVTTPEPDVNPDEPLHTDFTAGEKELFNNTVGLVIPFIPNNDYYVEEVEVVGGVGVNFYTFGNTQAEFDAYLALFSSYSYDGTTEDEYGDTWYMYSEGNVYIDIAYYNYEGDYVVDVYVYILDEEGEDVTDHLYTDFTADEKTLFKDIVGLVIPFIPNDEYYATKYEYETFGENCVHFYTIGNTQAEFEAYLELFSSYNFDDTFQDDYGDTWYYYSSGNIYIDVTYYFYNDNYVVDVYVYISNEGEDVNDPVEPEINYGTPNAPATTTYAYSVCANLEIGEFSAQPFYVKGTVTAIGITGKYYTNVYFTDGETEMLIYTINMPAGIDGFEVGDTITAYGYIKNYNGIIEMATFSGSEYVYVVKVEAGNPNQGDVTTPEPEETTAEPETTTPEPEVNYGSPNAPVTVTYAYNACASLENGEFSAEAFYIEGLVTEIGQMGSYYRDVYFTDGTTEMLIYTIDIPYYTDFFDVGDTIVVCGYIKNYNGIIEMATYNGSVYVYVVSVEFGDDLGGDDDWGDDDWGDDDWGDTEVDLITNDGKGLPEDDDGVYDVDFTKGEYVQNVTDQTYYLDGCPTTGTPAVLVIPIEFKDITAQSKGYSIENIKKIFNGTDLPYYSVYDYFLTSSYNQLSLDITVVDTWFRPKNSSSYYENATQTYYGEEEAIGDQLILDEALAYLATIMDLSEFDSDNNGIIDAVVMVNTLEIANDDFHWAYRYWNMYTDDEDYYYEYDGVSANDYVWIAYQFMFESTDQYGETNYNTSNPLNPYTFIHEFSHILGSDDYYDTEYKDHPLAGIDMMDSMMGDHNPYTKFNFGWITSSKLIVTNGTVTVNLDAFAKNGDTIILANNWDEALGAYQEYYVIMYYTMTGLNADEAGYFARDGIVVYHVNSSLYAEQYGNETYYMVYNTNTSSGDYGTKDNLIEFVKSGNDTYTYTVGDTLPSTTDDFGNELGYTFVIDSLDAESATITFTKK